VTRRVLGLQGWLAGALLAVGIVASLAVLLVVLPTLESSVRGDRAKREAQALVDASYTVAGRLARDGSVGRQELHDAASGLRATTGADVLIVYRAPFEQPISVAVPGSSSLIAGLHRQLVYGQPTPLDDGREVAAAVRLDVAGGDGSIIAARKVTGLAPELAIVRRRVIVAMIVVLALALLAGIALARLLGGPIRRLAATAAALSAGDLAARAPEPHVAPEEIVTLSDSLNGMAGRLQSLVGEITAERDRDRAMIGSLAEGVLAVAPDGTVVVANDAAGRILGLPEGAESARLEALPAPILDAVRVIRASGAPPPEPREVTLADGTEIELDVARIADSPEAGTVVTLRDVTDQRRLERARRDLVANVSHELKTPIAALKGFLELLEDERMDADHRRAFLGSMTQETARLERLVEEQLQLARLDAGALPLERERIDLADLAEMVASSRAALAAREGVIVEVRRPDAPVLADVDPARVEQILLILLDNAQRHTGPGGRVDLIVGGRDGMATVAVQDTGEGIPQDVQPFVFDRFYRGDASREGRSAGLGLAIARGLAAAHGGGIDLESRVGVGSTFTLRLPRTPVPAAAPDG
jgi:signal transduction histidine kinase/HAMP domain-containing protein